MKTHEIEEILVGYGKRFLGVYPRDLAPELKKGTGMIINTDPSEEPGEHWVAIYNDCDFNGVYFDSFGLPPLHEEILKVLNNSCNSWEYNDIQIQNLRSIRCGEYSIIFLMVMFENHSLKSFQNLFTKNSFVNESLIKIYSI